MRLLVVEDDAVIARVLRRGLVENAYAVDLIANGERALELASVNAYDAMVLDLMIPGADGFEVCRRLRASGSNLPILMLTARDDVRDKVAGLDAGADDYLVKPFQLDELLARLRALLRRGAVTSSPLFQLGELTIDTRSHHVSVAGRAMALTTKEYAMLEFLARNAGRVVTREEIAEHVWNEQFDPFTNLIEVYINRLRRRFEAATQAKLIHTIRGAGYMLDAG
jgi:two-component system copper resistance phosphate regulon response regulator CusR